MESLDQPPHIRSPQVVELALHLSSMGLLDADNAQIFGVAVKTIRRWRRLYVRDGIPRGGLHGGQSPPCPRCDERPLDAGAYAALLGFYLGDGHIANARGQHSPSLRLDIFQDARYPTSIAEIASIIERVKLGTVGFRDKPGCIAISSVWRHWPCLFPNTVLGGSTTDRSF